MTSTDTTLSPDNSSLPTARHSRRQSSTSQPLEPAFGEAPAAPVDAALNAADDAFDALRAATPIRGPELRSTCSLTEVIGLGT